MSSVLNVIWNHFLGIFTEEPSERVSFLRVSLERRIRQVISVWGIETKHQYGIGERAFLAGSFIRVP